MPLNEKTRLSITVGTAVGLIGFFIWATNGVNRTLTSIKDDMRAIKTELTERIDKVDAATQDRWTKTAMSEFAARLALNNRELRIPDPKDPARLLSEAPRSASDGFAFSAREYRR